jgi:serine/threonine protein kinase
VTRECDLHAKLSHPIIVHFVDSVERDGSLWLVMERSKGPTLEAVLRRATSPLEEHQILALFIQILSAVEYLHGNRILHRDLKPANIFLENTTHVKLGDFGVASQLPANGSLPPNDTIIGTSAYLAPEVIDCQTVSFSADIFSLGCILLEMITLEKPIDSYSHSTLSNWPSFPKGYTRGLETLVKSMMSADPKRRPTISEIWKTAVIACACNRPLKLEVVMKEVPEVPKDEKGRNARCEAVWNRWFGSGKRGVTKEGDEVREEVRNAVGDERFRVLTKHIENEFDDMESANYLAELGEENDFGLKLVREVVLWQ